MQNESDILAIVHGFQNRTLPKEKWTHEAHLVTAIWHHCNHAEHAAICLLRSGIITYNVATGGKNTAEDGYHETLTLFWSRVIRDFVFARKGMNLADLCSEFLRSDQARREYPLKFYSREVLFSLKARAVWVEPDLL